MTTLIYDELAELFQQISRDVDKAEFDGKLQDVITTLGPTVRDFKQLRIKAELHDVPDTLWSSLTKTIGTIMTLCEQRELRKERKDWASKWENYVQRYEKGKVALAAERKRNATLKAEVETLEEKSKAASQADRKRIATLEAEVETLEEKLEEAQLLATGTGDDDHHARNLERATAASDDKIKIAKANVEIADLKLTMVTKERDDALSQVARLQSQLQAFLGDRDSRDPHYQNYRSSPHDVSMAPLAQAHQMHSNLQSPSAGTPPSLLRSMQHSMQHTPPTHLQANNHYQSPPPHQGAYLQSSPRHSAYQASPPLNSRYYQQGSPSYSYQSYPSPSNAQGSYSQGPSHGHHDRLPPRPQTIGRAGTSRPQTSHDAANQQTQPRASSDQPLHSRYDRPESKGIRWEKATTATPVMTMTRGVASENARPTTSHSDESNPHDSAPVKETRGSAAPSKASTTSTKASSTKYGTLRKKLKGMRRPPYGYMTNTSGETVASEATWCLDNPIISWEGTPCFQTFSSPDSVPAFEDEQLEAMKQALDAHFVTLVWSKSCRRALRRRPSSWQGVQIESLKFLQLKKAMKMILAMVWNPVGLW